MGSEERCKSSVPQAQTANATSSTLRERFEARHGGYASIPAEERARQFKPFAALRDYGTLLGERAFVPDAYREVDEERQAALHAAIAALHRGDQVTLTYYTGAVYTQLTGHFRQIDESTQELVLESARVPLSALWSVE